MHWDGTRWNRVKVAQPTSAALLGAYAVSSTDVWAVGGATAGALTGHWDGRRWEEIPTDVPGGTELRAADGTSGSDVWAVGVVDTFTSVVEHWDGEKWSRVESPNAENDGTLTAVSAESRTDA